ncbi:hypothetical protein SK128_013859 [Halocaridina rubra]|uniref:Uncharacterized protein n=1 Tax=Halocaridina rubra TaxID=373956 RepID=A0AAN8WMN4_HALRR
MKQILLSSFKYDFTTEIIVLKVLDEQKCQCVCPKEAAEKCDDNGSRFMWDDITCSCQCTPQPCPANAFFIHETCSCMTNMD